MKEPRWCTAWMGARKKEDGWQWVDSGAGVPKKYFAANEFDNTDEGRGYGSFMPLGQPKQSPSDQDGRGLLYNTQNLDWSVHGYIIEGQAILGSSTYTLNAWAVSGHPREKELGEDKFYSSTQVAGGDVPLFSEGTGRACLGSPLNALAWLARVMARAGRPLSEGDVVLSGALGPMVAATPGAAFTATIEGFGETSIRFGA